ncbi:MAG: TIGR02300 family protein [Anaeromyxobacteraceae bacterium]
MPAKDLGVKHTCWKCSTKFYDLKKANAVCPKCGADPKAAPVVKAPTLAERRKAAKEEPVEEIAAEVDEADLEEVDEPAEEDAAEDADAE